MTDNLDNPYYLLSDTEFKQYTRASSKFYWEVKIYPWISNLVEYNILLFMQENTFAELKTNIANACVNSAITPAFLFTKYGATKMNLAYQAWQHSWSLDDMQTPKILPFFLAIACFFAARGASYYNIFTNLKHSEVDKLIQTEALKAGASPKEALKFYRYSQLRALKKGLPTEEALKFIKASQAEALKAGASPEEALKFNKNIQVEALKAGASVKEALKFTSMKQVNKLKSKVASKVDDQLEIYENSIHSVIADKCINCNDFYYDFKKEQCNKEAKYSCFEQENKFYDTCISKVIVGEKFSEDIIN